LGKSPGWRPSRKWGNFSVLAHVEKKKEKERKKERKREKKRRRRKRKKENAGEMQGRICARAYESGPQARLLKTAKN